MLCNFCLKDTYSMLCYFDTLCVTILYVMNIQLIIKYLLLLIDLNAGHKICCQRYFTTYFEVQNLMQLAYSN